MSGPFEGPDACTLPTIEQPLRAAEFDALFSDHVRRVELLGPTRLRLLLEGPAELAARVLDLTHRETACCSFFSFRVTEADSDGSEGGGLRLDVEVPPARSDMLAAIAERAEAMRAKTRVRPPRRPRRRVP